jgi:alpha-L-arabinofuranosidase
MRVARPVTNVRSRPAGMAAALILLLAAAPAARAQSAEPFRAELTVRADQPRGTISRQIYGHFAEHLGRLVYDGLWVGEDSSVPNTRGLRNDVVAALKRLQVPVLRWPGGCFADEYHWRDGVGPREGRPRRLNMSWGGVESNHFGTHEFMDLCELIGAEPYVAGNVGSGSPREMAEWAEYMTSDADTELTRLRRRNGRERPWRVPYFGVGNENWGCGGNMRAEYYADEFRRFATYVKDFSGNRVQRVAGGSSEGDYHWTEVLMSQAARHMQGLSFHFYTLPMNSWEGPKGSATAFGEPEWHATLARTLRMDEYIRRHGAIMDKYDPEKRVAMVVDEWGTWYDTEPGASALYQQNTLRDAVVAAVNLNIFHHHSDRVRMANLAQMVNVLQAVILTDKERMILTPTYHVMEMYKVHQGARHVPVELTAPEYRRGAASVPSLHASASRDEAGRLHLSIVNLDPRRPAAVSLRAAGANVRSAAGRVLTAAAVNAMNTFGRPDEVRPAEFSGARAEGGALTLGLPPKSVVVLELR